MLMNFQHRIKNGDSQIFILGKRFMFLHLFFQSHNMLGDPA